MSIDTVNDLAPRVQYTATASQTAFDYPFPIFADADLVVDIDGTTKTLTTHYTVSGEGEDAGGTVTLLSACAGGEVVTIYRDMALERTSDFSQNSDFSSASFNDELDKIVLMVQQLSGRVNRALRVPMIAETTDDEAELSPMSSWLGKYIYIDANGVPTPAPGTSVEAHTHGAADITSGDLDDARLSANVPLLDAAANFTAGLQTGGLAVGYLDIPTAVALTRGKIYPVTAGITINTATSGYCYGVYNNSASSVTLTQGSGLTQRLAGTATTGNLTLAQRGLATIWFHSATECVVIGNVT